MVGGHRIKKRSLRRKAYRIDEVFATPSGAAYHALGRNNQRQQAKKEASSAINDIKKQAVRPDNVASEDLQSMPAPGAFEKMQEDVGIPAGSAPTSTETKPIIQTKENYGQRAEAYDARTLLDEHIAQKVETRSPQERQIMEPAAQVKPPLTAPPGLPLHQESLAHQLVEGQPIKKPSPIPQFDTRFLTRDDKIPHPEEVLRPNQQIVKQGLSLEQKKVHYAPFPTTKHQIAYSPDETQKQRIDPDERPQITPEQQSIQPGPFPIETGPHPNDVGGVIKSEYDKLLKRPQPDT